MCQSERTQLIIVKHEQYKWNYNRNRLLLMKQRMIQPGSKAEVFLWQVVSGICLAKLVRNGDKSLSSIVNLLAMDLALWGLSKLLQHSFGYEGSWRLACKGKWLAYIDGGRGVGIPTIMGLALTSRKLPWEVENYFLYMEIRSQPPNSI